MKVKRILAGLSAAAMAASMMSMVSFAEGEDVTASAPSFGVQAFAQDNVVWSWNSAPDGGASFDSSNTATFTADVAALATAAKAAGGEESGVGAAGIQLYVANADDYETGTKLTGNVKVDTNSVLGAQTLFDGEVTLEKVQQSWGVEFNKNWSIAEGGASWSVLEALGSVEVTVTIDAPEDWTVTAPEAPEPVESEYDVAIPVVNDTYKGNWGGDGMTDGLDLSFIKRADGLKMTVSYSLAPVEESPKQNDDGEFYWDQNVFAPLDQHNWTKLGDSYEYDQDGWTIDPSITRATANDGTDEFDQEREAAEGPFMKKDGFIMVKEGGTLTFDMNEGMIVELIDKALANPGEDGGIWYGLGFQVYGVIIDKVVYEFNIDGETFNISEGISYNKSYEFDPTDDVDPDKGYNTAAFTLTGISSADKGAEEGVGSAWNDWCGYKIKITNNDGEVAYVAVGGAQAGWDFTVDDNGTADNKEDDYVIPADSVIKTDAEGNVEVILPYEYGYTYEVIAMGWDNEPDDPYIMLEKVQLYKAQSVPQWPEYNTGDEDSSEDSSEEETSTPEDESTGEETSNTPSTESDTSSIPSTSSQSSSKTDGGNNSKTGVAALGFGALTLAGAAVVITKKKF